MSEITPENIAQGKLPAALNPLKQYNHWVIWRWERDEKGDLTKVPYQARRPKIKAETNDPSTWGYYNEAEAAAHTADGIGFVLTDGDIAAFDLDDCRNATTGEIHPWVTGLIERAASYTEITPSGKGLRIIGWGKGNNNYLHREFNVIENMGECALYRKATRYITITGNQIGNRPLSDINAVMDATLGELEERKRKLAEQKRKSNGPGSPTDGGHHARQNNAEEEEDLDWLIRTGGDLPEGKRSDKGVYKVACAMLRAHLPRSAILSTLLDKRNGISEHIYAQNNPVEYAQKQIVNAAEDVGEDIPKIRSVEIRPGHIETFKVTIGDASMVVDAEALGDFRLFNRAAIAQLRRSFEPVRMKNWNFEVDRALRVAKEPIQLTQEQVRRHGTDSWRNEPVAWLVRERVPQQGVGLLSGMYSTFKSFMLLDLSGSVMTGLPFLKASTIRRGGVLIFAAEGANSLPMRTMALIEHRLAKETDDHPDLFKRSEIDLRRLPFSYVAHCRPLLDPKTVDWMVGIARGEQDYFQNTFGVDLVLIGIDTMSAAAGWDNENDAAQAQIVMNHLADVSKATSAFVLAADHFGKDVSAGTRGSVVKEASADAILATLGARDEETNTVDDTRLVIRKLRDGPQGDVFPFEARLVDMGRDQDGEPLTSRVIDWNVERVERVKPEKKSKARRALEEALTRALGLDPVRITVNGAEISAVSKEVLRSVFVDQYQQTSDANASAIRQAWSRALEETQGSIQRGVIEEVMYLWFPPSPM